jgi:hypothetical protein
MPKININKSMNVVTPLIQFQQNLRLSHWQTDSYAQHQAFGRTYDALDDSIDGLIEAYMGVYGRLKSNITFSIELGGLSNIESSIKDFLNFLSELRNHVEARTDLQNMVDEIIGHINTLKYLLTLK